jgi:TonB-linked SusC/RagA family outer membrane protein
MKKTKLHVFFAMLLLSCLFTTSVWSQTLVSGKVSNIDGELLPGVSVVAKGGNIGTITDLEGAYSLKVPSGTTLIFSSVGFVPQEVPVGTNTTLDIVLESDEKLLTEQIVTAFGQPKEKRTLAYAAQEVSGDQLVRSNEQNVVSGLQGKVAGALITNSSGAPGAGASILLRGISSLNPGDDNQPLIVIDGMVTSNATNAGNVLPSAGTNATGQAEQFSNSNRLSDINPNDIETVSVLKGSAATALYGSLAMNGAVIITTKKGLEGKPKITFSTNYGVDEINKYPAIQTSYREGVNGRLRVSTAGVVGATKFQDYGPLLTTPAFNNFKDIFGSGNRLSNNLAISGGARGFTFLLSGSDFRQNGILPGTNYNRSTVRLNTAFKAFDWLNLRGGVTYTNSTQLQANGGDKSVMSALSYHSNTFDVNDYKFADGSIKSYAGTIIDNPRWLAEFAPYSSKVSRYSSNIAAEAKLTPWLDVNYQIGLDQFGDIRRRIMPNVTDAGFQVGGFVVNQNLQSRIINSNLLVKLHRDFGSDFNAALTLGNSVVDNKFEEVGQRGEGLLNPGFYDISNATNLYSLYGFSQNRLIGAFGELVLDYKNYLTLTATGRNDWTSTLPKENRSFFYPSVGLSFIWTEALRLNSNIFTYGKLRLSYGETGQGTGPYRTGSYFGSAPRFPFNTTQGFRRSTVIGDLDLRPLRTKGTELGLEARFFKNRLGFDVTYYDQKTIDQIFTVPISNGTGFSAYVTNAGEVRNKGIEVSLNLKPIKTRDFEWDMRVNFSKNTGDVISTAPGIDRVVVYDGAYIVSQMVPGGKVGDLYGFAMLRDSVSGRLKIGVNGYPTLDASNLVKVGNAMPDFISALTNSFNYKGLSLSAQIEWKQGGDVYDMGRRNSIRNGNIAFTEKRHTLVVFKGVLPDGTENTKEVEIDGDNFYRSGALYNATAELLLQDASWVRLRNVSLSYAVPTNWLKNARIGSLSLSVTGNNLWLNTPYVGYDPEALQNGSGSNSYGFAGLTMPSVRSFSVGLNAGF